MKLIHGFNALLSPKPLNPFSFCGFKFSVSYEEEEQKFKTENPNIQMIQMSKKLGLQIPEIVFGEKRKKKPIPSKLKTELTTNPALGKDFFNELS